MDAVVAVPVEAARVETMLAATTSYAKSPDAQAVRRMYQLALEMDRAEVRYLMIYSALMLRAEQICGAANQGNVDRLLLTEDKSIATYPDPRNSKKLESVFTKVRNEFIHAEGRGRDAQEAAHKMANMVAGLKTLAARIIAAIP